MNSNVKPKILAFMQNQWFRDPVRMQAIFERQYQGDRERFIRTFLFFGCLTGKRLERAFETCGASAIDDVIFEEASPVIGGQASSVYPADLQHMRRVLLKHRPTRVITFGKIATDGLLKVGLIGGGINYQHFIAPHPAARGAGVMQELIDVVKKLLQP